MSETECENRSRGCMNNTQNFQINLFYVWCVCVCEVVCIVTAYQPLFLFIPETARKAMQKSQTINIACLQYKYIHWNKLSFSAKDIWDLSR